MGPPIWPLTLFLRPPCSALSIAAAPRESAHFLGGRSSLQLVLCFQKESWLWTHTAYARPLDRSAKRATALLKQRGDFAGIQACPHLSLLRLVFAGSLYLRKQRCFPVGCWLSHSELSPGAVSLTTGHLMVSPGPTLWVSPSYPLWSQALSLLSRSGSTPAASEPLC